MNSDTLYDKAEGKMTDIEQAELDKAESIATDNLPDEVKETIKSYILANDCLRLANESQRAEINELRLEVKRLKSETTDYRDWR